MSSTERPLRILQVLAGQDGGGIQPFAINLARELRARGHAPAVVVLRRGALFDALREAGLDPIHVRRRFRFDPGAALGIARVVRERGVDVVHTHSVPANLYARPGGRLGGARVVTSVHANTAHELRSALGAGSAARFAAWLDRRMAPLSDVLAPVSRDIGRVLVERGIPAERIVVVHNGIVDLPATDTVASLPEDFPHAGRPLVLTVGRLTPIKNLGVFLAAAAQLVARGVEADFVIVGDGPERARLEREAHRLELDGRVHFAGWRRDLERVYPHARAVVMTSTMEGLPTVILEGMRAGVPAVCSRVGGIPEVIEDDVTGYLRDPGDAAGFAEALERVLTDGAVAERLGRAARRRFEQHWTFTRVADEYEGIYRRLVAGRA